MIKNLLLFCLSVFFCTALSAQTIPAERVVIHIAPKATAVKVLFKLTDNSSSLTCDFGSGEAVKTYQQDAGGGFTTAEYTFATPSNNERAITLSADKLKTLRISSNKAVTGFGDIASNTLQTFNCDFTSLANHDHIDVSRCPALEVLTLVYSGVSSIKLPQSTAFKEVQVSPDALGKGSLTQINVDDTPNLQTLSITGASIDTLDLRANTKLTKLQAYSPKKVLRAILGIKELKLLQEVNLTGNALTFEQLPDLVADGATVDNFKYGSQRAFRINPLNIKGYTVNLSEMLFAQGIAKTAQTTKFEWKYKRNDADTFKDVPGDKMTSFAGEFTFDPSLSDDETIRLYVRISNDGYPGIGTKGSHTLGSNLVKLTKTTTDIQSLAHKGIAIETTSAGIVLRAEQPLQAALYRANGALLWKGTLPAELSVEKGLYILKTTDGAVYKIKK